MYVLRQASIRYCLLVLRVVGIRPPTPLARNLLCDERFEPAALCNSLRAGYAVIGDGTIYLYY